MINVKNFDKQKKRWQNLINDKHDKIFEKNMTKCDKMGQNIQKITYLTKLDRCDKKQKVLHIVTSVTKH